MKFKYFYIFLIFFSCTTEYSNNKVRSSYTSTGFAYIYDNKDYENKIISKKFDNYSFTVAHNKLRLGSSVQITNPSNNKKVILKITKRVKYPDLYKILITEAVSNKLSLDKNLPFVEINEIKKNKSFVAKKSKTFNEEKKIHDKAPVTNVIINNISKSTKKSKIKKPNFSIVIANFYSLESAKTLRKNLVTNVDFSSKKLSIRKLNNNSFELIAGPYKALNSLKNDYIDLKKYGFEDLDFRIK